MELEAERGAACWLMLTVVKKSNDKVLLVEASLWEVQAELFQEWEES